jgi:hypothetical protein
MNLRIYLCLKNFAYCSMTLVSFTLMASCSVGPNFLPPRTDVPSQWDAQEVVTPEQPSKTVSDPVTLVDWWRSFKDPTLNSLVSLASETNPDIRQVEAGSARPGLPGEAVPVFPKILLKPFERSQVPALPLFGNSGFSPPAVS